MNMEGFITGRHWASPTVTRTPGMTKTIAQYECVDVRKAPWDGQCGEGKVRMAGQAGPWATHGYIASL